MTIHLPGEDLAENRRRADRIAAAENHNLLFAHLSLWAVAVAVLGVIVWTDMGGLATMAANAVDGWRFVLPLAALAVTGWLAYSSYRREKELLELERRFLLNEIKSLALRSGG